jgi:hypothetical protein
MPPTLTIGVSFSEFPNERSNSILARPCFVSHRDQRKRGGEFSCDMPERRRSSSEEPGVRQRRTAPTPERVAAVRPGVFHPDLASISSLFRRRG